MSKPNILWICTDQQRWDTLGCYGNEYVNTPNIDRLAAEGVRFARAYCQSPVCTPSRAGFLTGRYPRATRCRQNGQDIPADEVLVTRMLADGGYRCGLAGKLHLSACHPDVCPEMERRIDDGYTEFHWSHHPMPGWGSHNEYWAWLEGKGHRFHTPSRDDSAWVKTGMPESLHQTTWCTDKALDFVSARADDCKPWLFSLNYFDPHHPFDPPAEYLEPYLARLDELPLPNHRPGELADKPAYQQADHQKDFGPEEGQPFSDMTDRDHRLVRASYWAMCDLIDRQVGRLLEGLERSGMRENTIVIFMSDHGEMLGDHGMYLKGPYFYEEAVRVPLIIHYPQAIAPGVVGELVELTDLAPTLVDACGVSPADRMQGRSLWGRLTGEAALAPRKDVYCEYYNAMPRTDTAPPFLTMVRDERYKVVVDHGTDAGELYDLQEDPAESHNLWHSAAHQAVKLRMLLRVSDRQAETVDPAPARRAVW